MGVAGVRDGFVFGGIEDIGEKEKKHLLYA